MSSLVQVPTKSKAPKRKTPKERAEWIKSMEFVDLVRILLAPFKRPKLRHIFAFPRLFVKLCDNTTNIYFENFYMNRTAAIQMVRTITESNVRELSLGYSKAYNISYEALQQLITGCHLEKLSIFSIFSIRRC